MRGSERPESSSRAASVHPESSFTIPSEAPLNGAPVRQYINSKVTGPLLEGMKMIAKEQYVKLQSIKQEGKCKTQEAVKNSRERSGEIRIIEDKRARINTTGHETLYAYSASICYNGQRNWRGQNDDVVRLPCGQGADRQLYKLLYTVHSRCLSLDR